MFVICVHKQLHLAWCIVIIARDRGPSVVAQIILALFIGYAVAAFVTADGKRYVATTEINNAVGGTFLWVRCPRKPALDLEDGSHCAAQQPGADSQKCN